MAEKLSWTELRRTLASRAGVSEKKAGAFLNAFQEQLSEALKTDKQVKINGLGTFKVQSVAPRKSVNVVTGEDIIIEGYNKLSFTPEAGVKELIEKYAVLNDEQVTPAIPQPQEIDPLKKLGEQAEEIVDILGELGQSPKLPQQEPEPLETPTPEPEIPESRDPEPPAEPVFVPLPIPEPAPQPEPQPAPKPQHHFMRDTLICVAVLLLLLFVGFFFLRQQLSNIIDSFLQPAPQTEIVTIPEEPIEIPESREPEIPTDTIEVPTEPVEVPVKTPEVNLPPSERYPELITIEEMHEASRLTWMAKRFYGDKKYWPYLYDANRDIITNPGMIQVGTPIRVPKLTKLQLDTTNEQTAAYLEQLRLEAEEACKK